MLLHLLKQFPLETIKFKSQTAYRTKFGEMSMMMMDEVDSDTFKKAGNSFHLSCEKKRNYKTTSQKN